MFKLNQVEKDRLNFFLSMHNNCICKDAMCQKYEYRFYPGGVGTSIIVKCLICEMEENITDFDSW